MKVLTPTLERQMRKTDAQLANLRDAVPVIHELYKLRLSEARDAVTRALTQLREHAPGAAVETLEAWLEKNKAL